MVRRTATWAGALAALLGASCGGSVGPARIAYPAPWIGTELGTLAQAAIDGWGVPRVAEVSVAPKRDFGSGYAADIAFAEAVVGTPGVAAAVGPQSSMATLLVAPIYAEAGVPLISATATSDSLGGRSPWVFQLAPSNAAEGAFIAQFAIERLGARRVTIFYLDADEYGLSLQDGVVRALRARNVAPVDQVGFVEGADLPRRVDESLRRATPDVVVVAARATETLAIVRALRARRPGVAVVAGDGVPMTAVFLRPAGAAAEGLYAVSWWNPDSADPRSREFAASYRRATGRPADAAAAMYYDAILLAATAIREAGPHPAAVRRWLAALGTTRAPYAGVTGPISFAPGRRTNLLMMQIAAGAAAAVPGAEASRP